MSNCFVIDLHHISVRVSTCEGMREGRRERGREGGREEGRGVIFERLMLLVYCSVYGSHLRSTENYIFVYIIIYSV